MDAALAAGRFQRRMGLSNLKAFCHENRFTLRGYLPSRTYLSKAGRIDLASVIRNNGGPNAVARALGLFWGGPEEELGEHLGENAGAALDGVAGAGAEAEAGARARARAGAGSGAGAGGRPEVFRAEDPDLFTEIEAAVRRGLVFVVEHSKDGDGHGEGEGEGRAEEPSWVLFKCQKSLGDSIVTANSLLAEARVCCATYSSHRVRITALDTADGGQRLSYEIFLARG